MQALTTVKGWRRKNEGIERGRKRETVVMINKQDDGNKAKEFQQDSSSDSSLGQFFCQNTDFWAFR